MKKAVMLSLALLMAIIVAGPASATHFNNPALTADCEGWNLSGEVVLGYEENSLNYYIELYEGSTLIEEYSGSEDFLKSIDPSPLFDFSGMWNSELCGEYTARALLEVTSGGMIQATEELTVTFVCDCPPPPPPPSDICSKTPGYWKNHEDMWPVSELFIGDQAFYKDELLALLNTQPNKDKRMKLVHHLIAAKLNILQGATCEGIDYAVASADDFLIMYPLISKLPKGLMDTITDLKAPLEEFNELPCEEDDTMMFGAGYNDERDEKSWGSIKNIYKKK